MKELKIETQQQLGLHLKQAIEFMNRINYLIFAKTMNNKNRKYFNIHIRF